MPLRKTLIFRHFFLYFANLKKGCTFATPKTIGPKKKVVLNNVKQ